MDGIPNGDPALDWNLQRIERHLGLPVTVTQSARAATAAASSVGGGGGGAFTTLTAPAI